MVDYWYASARGMRPTMEDRHVVAERSGWMLFAVLDGHGGREIVDQAAVWLPSAVLPVLIRNTSRPTSVLKTIVHRIVIGLDRRLQARLGQSTKAGSTLLLSAYHPETRRLILASVGDSRGIIIRNTDGSIVQTVDHKPDDPNEKWRIEAAGGFVDRGRVGRILAMSRAIGDFPLKNRPDGRYDAEAGPVSAAPQVLVGYVDGPTTIVLACDGVFDVLDSETAASIVVRSSVDANPADRLMREAFRFGSRDNITALVVRITD